MDATKFALKISHARNTPDIVIVKKSLQELAEKIHSSTKSIIPGVFHDTPRIVEQVEAIEGEIEGVEEGENIHILFDETLSKEAPVLTENLVKEYASFVYDAHPKNIQIQKI